MKSAKSIFDLAGVILFVGILLLVIVTALRPITPGQPVVQQRVISSVDPAYPPPEQPNPTSTPINTATEVPIAFLVTRTPIPITPVPTLTLKPGPEPTAIPPVSIASDSSGSIFFIAKESKDTKPTVNKVSVNGVGTKVNAPVKVDNNEVQSDGFVFESPNGKYLAITGPWGRMDIFDIEKNEFIKTEITIGSDSIFFNWFPDDQKILFGGSGLILADLLTGEETRLAVPGYGGIVGAGASPDGKLVAYSYTRNSPHEPGLWIINSNGQNAHLLWKGMGEVTNISWSPNGNQIAFNEGGWKVINADGSNLQDLGFEVILPQCYFLPPLWSPNSHKLAVVTSKTGDSFCEGWTNDNLKGTNIVIIDVGQKKSMFIPTENNSGNIDPTWAPDGSQLAFVSRRSGTPEIWAINADGTNLRQLTENNQFVRFPKWFKTK